MTLTKSQKERRKNRSSVAASSQAKQNAPKVKSKPSKSKMGQVAAAYGQAATHFSIEGLEERVVNVQGWLASITVPVTTFPKVITSVQINPNSLIPNSRLARFSQLYEKFRFEELEFEYLPNVGTNQQGSLFMAADADPADNLADMTGLSLMNAVSSTSKTRFVQFPCYGTGSPVKLVVKGKDFFSEDLYVDASKNGDRWSSAGQFFIGCASAFAQEVIAGTVIVRARVRFMVPALESPSAGGGFYGLMAIVNPTSTYPWGTLPGISTSLALTGNVEVLYLNKNPSTGSAGSFLKFSNPGVYSVVWYQRGTSLALGTITYGNGASAGFPPSGSTIYDNQVLHPNGTETIGIQLVSVPEPDGFIGYTQNGSHSGSLLPRFLQVTLTNLQPPPLTSAAQLQSKMVDLTNRLAELKVMMQVRPQPLAPGEEFETTSSSSTTGSLTSFNSPTLNIVTNTEGTATTVGLPDLRNATSGLPDIRSCYPPGWVVVEENGQKVVKKLMDKTS